MKEKFQKFLDPEFLMHIGIIIGAIVILYLIYISLKKILKRIPDEKVKPRIKNIILKILKYTFLILVIVYILDLFGINLNTVFGAAGIVGLALGLAAQTALGNIISGFFVMNEKVFKIGDHVVIEEIEGNIEAVDLLSVKIRTFDNQIVRIPNETVIKTKLQNFSAFQNRRICLYTTFPYGTDLKALFPQLENAIRKTKYVLPKLECSVVCWDFNDNGALVRVVAWTKYANFIECRNNVIITLNNECLKRGVKIQCTRVEVSNQEENTKQIEFASAESENISVEQNQNTLEISSEIENENEKSNKKGNKNERKRRSARNN